MHALVGAGVTSAAGLSLAFAGDYLKPFLDLPPGAGILAASPLPINPSLDSRLQPTSPKRFETSTACTRKPFRHPADCRRRLCPYRNGIFHCVAGSRTQQFLRPAAAGG